MTVDFGTELGATQSIAVGFHPPDQENRIGNKSSLCDLDD